MKKTIKKITGGLTVLSFIYFALIGWFYYNLPTEFNAENGEAFALSSLKLLNVDLKDGTQPAEADCSSLKSADIKLLGVFPVKSANVNFKNTQTVSVGGTPFGIKFLTDGVTVVDVSGVETEYGNISPAAECGFRSGDRITSVNGKSVRDSIDITKTVGNSGGNPLSFTVVRNGETLNITITPTLCTDGVYRIGLYLKDSAAGIGTMTFYDSETGIFAGLGHPITDGKTENPLSLKNGEITEAEIYGVSKGEKGSPGELKGKLLGGAIGTLSENTITGVYGTLSSPESGTEYPIGYKQTVKTGPAKIITTIDETGPETYDIVIEKVNIGDNSLSKNMIIKVVDENLIRKTGGIVQGMSGSPIIQNGRLIGAVTHVFVGDPTGGYGIFIENMLETAQAVANEYKLKDAS